MDGGKGSSQVGPTLASASGTSQQNNWFRRFVSGPLAAQTIPSGTWTMEAAIQTSNTTSAWKFSAIVYVWRPSNGTKVANVVDAVTTGIGTAAGSTETSTGVATLTASGASVTTVSGDILVIEVWGTVTQSKSTSRTWTLYYDGTTEGSTTSSASFINAPAALTLNPVAVTGSESIAESGKVVVSETPTGAEKISESGKIVISEAPKGAESISESSVLKLSQAPQGSETISESGKVIASEKPTGAESISVLGKAVVSENPTGAEGISVTGKATVSANPTGAGHITMSASAVVTMSVSGSGMIGVVASLSVTNPAAPASKGYILIAGRNRKHSMNSPAFIPPRRRLPHHIIWRVRT